MTTEWLVPAYNKGNCVKLIGCYPHNFDWTPSTLGSRLFLMRTMKIIFGRGSRFPSLLIGPFPLPLIDYPFLDVFEPDFFSKPHRRVKMFNQWIGRLDFTWVRVQIGSIENDRFKFAAFYVIPVPSPSLCFDTISSIPRDKDVVVVRGNFAIRDRFFKTKERELTRDVEFQILRESGVIASSRLKNFDHYFSERPSVPNRKVERHILSFLHKNLSLFTKNEKSKITAILLDVDPESGYVILSIKTGAIASTSRLDIDDFEYSEFACLEAKELFGNAKYHEGKEIVLVLNKILMDFSKEERIKRFASSSGLHLSYAVHDKPIKWIAKVSGSLKIKTDKGDC